MRTRRLFQDYSFQHESLFDRVDLFQRTGRPSLITSCLGSCFLPHWKAPLLTCGRFWPGSGAGPAHQVGLSHCRLRRVHFASQPPYPHCVVIGTGSNLAAERGGLHRNQISARAHQGAQLHSRGGQCDSAREETSVEEIYSGTKLQRTSKKKLVDFTLVKSVGHQATEVTSSLWPCRVTGGSVGSEIWSGK